jgi:hypothetical protein
VPFDTHPRYLGHLTPYGLATTLTDNPTFQAILDAACSQSKLPSPPMSDEEIGDIRAELSQTLEVWRVLAVGESLTLNY